MNLKHIQIDRHVLNQLQPSCEHYLGGDCKCFIIYIHNTRGDAASSMRLEMRPNCA